ncbi:MAG: class I SAM-dependent methyltransferase [bacterium JZ-2024 1]
MVNPAHSSRDFWLCLRQSVVDCQSVLELGCGSGDNLCFLNNVKVRVGVDIFEPCVRKAVERTDSIVYLKADAFTALTLFPEETFDAILMIDFIEHIERGRAELLIHYAKMVSRKKIIIFTPNGFVPQTTDDRGLGNDYYMTHRSGWTAESLLALGFDVAIWEKDNDRLIPSLFAVWTKEK